MIHNYVDHYADTAAVSLIYKIAELVNRTHVRVYRSEIKTIVAMIRVVLELAQRTAAYPSVSLLYR